MVIEKRKWTGIAPAEIKMVRWMCGHCGVKLSDKLFCFDLSQQLGTVEQKT